MDGFGVVILVLIVLLLGVNQLTLWAIERRVTGGESETINLGCLLVDSLADDDDEPTAVAWEYEFDTAETNGASHDR